MSVPRKDLDLASFSKNFDEKINQAAQDYSLTQQEAEQYTPLHLAFISSYNALVAARSAGIESRPLISQKDQHKLALRTYARELYARVAASLSVSDAKKIELGIVVRSATRTPVAVPDRAPAVRVVSVDGHWITVSIQDATEQRKGRAAGAAGAVLYSCASERSPEGGPERWKTAKIVTRSPVTIVMPATAAPGTKVWLTAAWFNARGHSPACTPVCAHVGFDGALPLAA